MYCLLFPGQGVQRRGMGTGLFERFDGLTARADEVLGYSIADLCLRDPQGRLKDTAFAQPAIFFVNALLGLERSEQRTYDYFAGHSLGEYNALVAARSLDLFDALALVRERARLMATIRGGGMAAVVGLDAEAVADAWGRAGRPGGEVANRNSDQQTVLAGDREQLRLAANVLKLAGARAVTMLNVSGPFHSSLMAPAALAFESVVGGYRFAEPTGVVMSTVTAAPFAWQKATDLLCRQIDHPVEWVRTVNALRAAGVTDVDEVNGATLTTLIRGIH